jgi:Cyclic nucleotide-binding domain
MQGELTFKVVSTLDEIRAAQRIRYQVYCEETDMLYATADHDARLLPEPEDERGLLMLALLDGEPVGSVRLLFGADDAIPSEYGRLLRVDEYAEVVGIERVVVVDRLGMVGALRGDGSSAVAFILAVVREICSRRVDVVVADCEPHLVPLYRALGMRPSGPAVDLGPRTRHLVVVPLVAFLRDHAHFRAVRSPVLNVVEDVMPSDIEANLLALLPDGTDADDDVFHREHIALFDGLPADARRTLLERGDVLHFDAGSRVLNEGKHNSTVYVVLDGRVSVWSSSTQERTAEIGPGEMFGHFAWLLRRPRTAAVVAEEATSVLALSSSTMDQLVDRDPVAALHVYRNVAVSAARLFQKRTTASP